MDIDHPSSSPSSFGESEAMQVRAATLPVDVLIHLFSYAIEVPLAKRPHGGYLESWQSNESMSRLTRVCKGWSEAATTVLYHSVALVDRSSTAAFVRTLTASPPLCNKVNYLVISLSEDVLQGGSLTWKRLDDSLALLSALQRCVRTVTHLQIHPLHGQVRSPLFATMKACERLQVLVCSPRFYDPSEQEHMAMQALPRSSPVDESSPGSDFYSRSDLFELALPAPLHTLELDFDSSWSTDVLPFHHNWQLNGLRKLRLRADTDEDILWEVLGQCSELEVCELYFERLLSRDETTAALQPSAPSMKHIHFLCNPTYEDLAHFDSTAEPIFDRLLPLYHRLETLSISATEVSSRVIRLVPPSLEALVVQAFNHVSTFTFTQQLVADIHNPAYARGLRSLRVHDAAEAWEEEHITLLREACEGRGWDFAFIVDESQDSSLVGQ